MLNVLYYASLLIPQSDRVLTNIHDPGSQGFGQLAGGDTQQEGSAAQSLIPHHLHCVGGRAVEGDIAQPQDCRQHRKDLRGMSHDQAKKWKPGGIKSW